MNWGSVDVDIAIVLKKASDVGMIGHRCNDGDNFEIEGGCDL